VRSQPISQGLHVGAAAQAAVLALTRGDPGIYNIADDDGAVPIAKVHAALGFDPEFSGYDEVGGAFG